MRFKSHRVDVRHALRAKYFGCVIMQNENGEPYSELHGGLRKGAAKCQR
jgi:hypothetical protein